MVWAERSQLTVLVVDDDARLLASAKRSLAEAYRVLTATTADAARVQCVRTTVHLAIVDLCLVGETGLDLLRDLKRDHPAIRSALLTGLLTFEATAEAAIAGARLIAVKPVSLKALLRVLETTTKDVTVLADPPRAARGPATSDATPAAERLSMQAMKRRRAREAYEHNDHNASRAASELGISRSHFYTLLGKVNIHE